MPNFISIRSGILILWGSNFWLSHKKEKSPLTHGLNYRSACDWLVRRKTVAGRHKLAAYHNKHWQRLSWCINIDDLEPVAVLSPGQRGRSPPPSFATGPPSFEATDNFFADITDSLRPRGPVLDD